MLLTKKQLDGAVVLVAFTTLFFVYGLFALNFHPDKMFIPYSDKNSGNNIVEIKADSGISGIYFLKDDATVKEALNIASIANLQNINRDVMETKLIPGSAIFVSLDNHVEVRKMSNAARLHFNLPVDINTASPDDLMLIPGIGEKTAWRIVEHRQKYGLFHDVKDLIKIEGIKEKKLSGLSKYFYIDKRNF